MPTITDQPQKAEPGSGIIRLHLRELNQLFNSMDPSPFRDKDLDDDAEEFIVSWAREFPPDKPLSLVIHLDQGSTSAEASAALMDSVHVFFKHRSELSTQRLHQLLRVGRKSLVIGLCFLIGCLVAGQWIVHLLHNDELSQVAGEGLEILGWVAMW